MSETRALIVPKNAVGTRRRTNSRYSGGNPLVYGIALVVVAVTLAPVVYGVLGGFRTFSGPIIGAVVFNYLKVYAVASTAYWQFMLGAVLLVLVLALPTGIVGTLARQFDKLRKRG